MSIGTKNPSRPTVNEDALPFPEVHLVPTKLDLREPALRPLDSLYAGRNIHNRIIGILRVRSNDMN
jgi:hypothetical protein